MYVLVTIKTIYFQAKILRFLYSQEKTATAKAKEPAEINNISYKKSPIKIIKNLTKYSCHLVDYLLGNKVYVYIDDETTGKVQKEKDSLNFRLKQLSKEGKFNLIRGEGVELKESVFFLSKNSPIEIACSLLDYHSYIADVIYSEAKRLQFLFLYLRRLKKEKIWLRIHMSYQTLTRKLKSFSINCYRKDSLFQRIYSITILSQRSLFSLL